MGEPVTRWALTNDDTVIAAWAEYTLGPDWSDGPLWVLVQRRSDSTFRLERLLPNEQSREMRALFEVSAVVSAQLRALVTHHLRCAQTMKRADHD